MELSLKPILELITNHSARYSFITNALNENNLSVIEASKITGQSIKVLIEYERGDKVKKALEIAPKVKGYNV